MPHPLTIFIYEHLTSGACVDVPLESSLITEGRAMAEAVIADFAVLEDVQVVTLRDFRFPPNEFKNVATHGMSTSAEAEIRFHNLGATADRILIIAPESQGILQQRLDTARKLNPLGVLNAFGQALEVGCDKWTLAEFCRQWDIPHLPTELWAGQDLGDLLPAIIKPRDGAGCEEIQILHSQSAVPEQEANGRKIVQRWRKGISLSSAACYSSIGERILTLPLGRQHLEIGDTVQYLGGELPWQHASASEANRQAEMIWHILEQQLVGLWGYISIDWLWDDDSQLLRLVEINPRLSTSYVGYRQLFGDQIVTAILERAFTLPSATLEIIRFSAKGTVETISTQGALQ